MAYKILYLKNFYRFVVNLWDILKVVGNYRKFRNIFWRVIL